MSTFASLSPPPSAYMICRVSESASCVRSRRVALSFFYRYVLPCVHPKIFHLSDNLPVRTNICCCPWLIMQDMQGFSERHFAHAPMWPTYSPVLQIRIEQVVTTSLPLVLCFKLSQLLAFYGRTVEQMMGGSAHLTQTLAECHKLATRVFHEHLKARGSKLLQQIPAPTPQLTAPPQVSLNALAIGKALILHEWESNSSDEYAQPLASGKLILSCQRCNSFELGLYESSWYAASPQAICLQICQHCCNFTARSSLSNCRGWGCVCMFPMCSMSAVFQVHRDNCSLQDQHTAYSIMLTLVTTKAEQCKFFN